MYAHARVCERERGLCLAVGMCMRAGESAHARKVVAMHVRMDAGARVREREREMLPPSSVQSK